MLFALEMGDNRIAISLFPSLSLVNIITQKKEWVMKRLYRSKKDAKLGGICGGLGEILEVDPTLIRLIFVFLAMITGVLPLVVTYLIAWFIIPEGPVE